MRSVATPLVIVAVAGAFAAPAAARPADLGPPASLTTTAASDPKPASPLLSPRRFNHVADRAPIAPSARAASGEATDPAPGLFAAAGTLTLLLCAGVMVLARHRRRTSKPVPARVPRSISRRGARLCPFFDDEIRAAQERRLAEARKRVRSEAA